MRKLRTNEIVYSLNLVGNKLNELYSLYESEYSEVILKDNFVKSYVFSILGPFIDKEIIPVVIEIFDRYNNELNTIEWEIEEDMNNIRIGIYPRKPVDTEDKGIEDDLYNELQPLAGDNIPVHITNYYDDIQISINMTSLEDLFDKAKKELDKVLKTIDFGYETKELNDEMTELAREHFSGFGY